MCYPDHRYSTKIEQLWLLISESFHSIYDMPWLLSQEKLAVVTLFLQLCKISFCITFLLPFQPFPLPQTSINVPKLISCNFPLRYLYSALGTYSLDYIFIIGLNGLDQPLCFQAFPHPSHSPEPMVAPAMPSSPQPCLAFSPPDPTPAHSTACPQGDARGWSCPAPLWGGEMPRPALTAHHAGPQC